MVDLEEYCFEGNCAKKQNLLKVPAIRSLTESTPCHSGRRSVPLSYLAANKYTRKDVYVL